jgi:hypothetical protein
MACDNGFQPRADEREIELDAPEIAPPKSETQSWCSCSIPARGTPSMCMVVRT